MKKLLPVFSLPVSPLALSSSSSHKFLDVAKLQLVGAKYVTQQWPETNAFFHVSRSKSCGLMYRLCTLWTR